jgi:hypothetical protein
VKFRCAMLCFSLGLLLSSWAQPAAAQWRQFPRLRAVAQRQGANPAKNFNPDASANGGTVRPGQPNLRGMAGLPPKWIENLREMPPEQQERFLQNNRAFQNFPPQRQAQIRKNLENWNKLSPDERQEIRDREQILERLSPAQRVYLRDTLLPKWQAMPVDRRKEINNRLHILQQMGPGAQQAALADPKFMRDLSPDEQSMLRDLNSYRNPAAPSPSNPAAPQQ